ncbi:hypothetical protein BG841_15850 [Marinobacter sp. X15-166B]|nr:hypothetical protein BG841_15850 [Marinobacter sp. X15-166B]
MEEHNAEFVWCETVGEKLTCFEEFLILNEKRATERGIQSSVARDSFRQHHRRVIENLPNARIYCLRLDGDTIAVVYGFLFAARFFYYQVAHDPAYGHLSPGKVLLFRVMTVCAEQGCKEFNFLQGNEAYKSFWADQSRPLFQLKLEKDNWRVWLLRRFNRTKNWLKTIRDRSHHGH